MSSPQISQYAQLLALEEDIQPPEFTLEADVCTIGRSNPCHVIVPREVVSRLHAKIERDGPRYVLRDAGSVNGTFVNSRRIDGPYMLKDRDLIGLGMGAALLRFKDPDPTKAQSSRLHYDERLMKFSLDQEAVVLTPREFNLLLYLYQNAGSVCTRESCCERLWGKNYDPGQLANLEGVIAGIRRALRRLDPDAEYIQTRHGLGYELVL